MKVLKGISLFFLYPFAMFCIGILGGIKLEQFFYPYTGKENPEKQWIQEENLESDIPLPADTGEEPEAKAVTANSETLSADTEYILIETDLLHETEVETSWRIPTQYIGMDRDQFLMAVENYAKYPPLSEIERGFVSMEVEAFARERVVVRVNYQYPEPDGGFYLAVRDHEVVVYLTDKQTIFINTGIMLDSLPENIQQQVIQMFYMEDEGKLYNFLETYSS